MCGSGPQPFWHQGPVLWKKIFPRMVAGGMVQAVMRAMGSGRWSFASLPAAHLLLCGPVPNRPQTSTGPQPGGWGPLMYDIIYMQFQDT